MTIKTIRADELKRMRELTKGVVSKSKEDFIFNNVKYGNLITEYTDYGIQIIQKLDDCNAHGLAFRYSMYDKAELLKANEITFDSKNGVFFDKYNDKREISYENLDSKAVESIELGELLDIQTFNLKELIWAIKSVEKYVSKDDSRPKLKGMHFKNNEIVALDGYRLKAKTLSSKFTDGINFSLPFETTKMITNFGKKIFDGIDNTTVKVYEKYVELIVGDFTITSKKLDGHFMDYESLVRDVSIDKKLDIKMDTKQIKEHLNFI